MEMNLEWLAPSLTAFSLILTAVGSLVASIVAAILALRSSKQAAEARDQSAETHNAVNGRMDEFMRMAKEKYLAEGALAEKEAQAAKNAGRLPE